MEHDLEIIIVGPAGAGKTLTAFELATLLQKNGCRLTLEDDGAARPIPAVADRDKWIDRLKPLNIKIRTVESGKGDQGSFLSDHFDDFMKRHKES